MATYFSEYFGVDQRTMDEYGALNVSIVNDLSLFIDPFLLFNSENEEYRELYDSMINYLIFLRDKAQRGHVSDDLLKVWYCFPEVKENWLGFSMKGNGGTGLGLDFARALHSNLHRLFSDFGSEKITKGSHMEKVCLIRGGIGRDNISDFTTNLIKDYLCKYTEEFAKKHIDRRHIRAVTVNKCVFNYDTEAWDRRKYDLPWGNGGYFILTPKDILTRDENWINRSDPIHDFEDYPAAIPDAQLRAQVFNYFEKVLVKHRDRDPSQKERGEAAAETLMQFPQLIDHYIKYKEDNGDQAADISNEKVIATEFLFIKQIAELQRALAEYTKFYQIGRNTYEESHARLQYLKDVIENKGGHRLF